MKLFAGGQLVRVSFGYFNCPAALFLKQRPNTSRAGNRKQSQFPVRDFTLDKLKHFPPVGTGQPLRLVHLLSLPTSPVCSVRGTGSPVQREGKGQTPGARMPNHERRSGRQLVPRERPEPAGER